MAGDAEFLFGLDLGRQAVAVPAEAPLDPAAAHGLVARDGVLDEAGQQVAVVRQAVGERRAVVEDELVVAVDAGVTLFDERSNVDAFSQMARMSSSRAGKFGFGSTAGYGTPRCYRAGSRPPMDGSGPRSSVSDRLRSSSNVKRKSSSVGLGRSGIVEAIEPGAGRRRIVDASRRPSRTAGRRLVVGRFVVRRRPDSSSISVTITRSIAWVGSRSSATVGVGGIVDGVDVGRRRRRSSLAGRTSAGRPSSAIVVGRRQQRAAHVAEAGGHAVGDLDQFGRRVADASTLRDEELLEVVDVGLEEITAGLEGVDLAGGQQPLGLACSTGFLTGLLEHRRGHLARRVAGRAASSFAVDTSLAASARASAISESAVRCASTSVRLIVSD